MAKLLAPYVPEIHDIVLYRGTKNIVLSIGGVGTMQDVPPGSTEFLSHEPTVLLVNITIVENGMDRKHNSFRVATNLVTFVGKWDHNKDLIVAAPAPTPTRELIVEHLSGFRSEGLTISQLAHALERPSAAIHSSLQSLKTAGVVVQRETQEWLLA